MENPREIEASLILANNRPVDEFLGLSPNEMQHLLYDPLGPDSVVQVRTDLDDEVLDQIPLFRVLEAYLLILQREGQLKLTPLGALPRKVLTEVYEKRHLPDEHIESGLIKLTREIDWPALSSTRFAAEYGGIVRKANNRLTLTKKVVKLLETNKRRELFILFLKAFTEKFLWSSNDGYPEIPAAQQGWAFSVYMLFKFGDTPRLGRFYGSKYSTAFPVFLTYFGQEQLLRCYNTRTFYRFMLWFGWVKVNQDKDYLEFDINLLERTPLLEKTFRLEV